MQKDKIDFIVDLLADNRIEAPFKEKVSDLATKELKRIFSVESENRERVIRIEAQLQEFKIALDKPIKPIEKEKEKKIIYHNPREIVNFLRLFDSDLKYLTHKWESKEELDRESLIKKGKTEIDKYKWGKDDNGISKIEYKVPDALWIRVSNFIDKAHNRKENASEWFAHYIFGKKVESYYSWNNEKFIAWFDNAITKDITSPEINDNMIEPFKNSIQIRDGNFQKHIEPLVDKELGTEFGVEYKNLEQAKFYTDVQGLMSGIKNILKISIKRWASELDRFKIKFEFVENRDQRFLKIIHIKSKCSKNSFNPDLIGGDLKAIAEKSFNKICNWSIEATFADGNKRINILSDNKNLNEIEDIDYEPEGFTHILYFY